MIRITVNNSGLWSIARIHSTARRNIPGFQAGKRKVSSQDLRSVVYITMDLDSHADTIVCGSNCIIIHFTDKECDILPYTDAYEMIKSVPIVQVDTAYDNTETGDNTIIISNEAIRMGETMDHTLVNPNQLRAYGMKVQDNPFAEAPIFIATEDHDFMPRFSYKGIVSA